MDAETAPLSEADITSDAMVSSRSVAMMPFESVFGGCSRLTVSLRRHNNEALGPYALSQRQVTRAPIFEMLLPTSRSERTSERLRWPNSKREIYLALNTPVQHTSSTTYSVSPRSGELLLRVYYFFFNGARRGRGPNLGIDNDNKRPSRGG
jgi:hypothetical protein